MKVLAVLAVVLAGCGLAKPPANTNPSVVRSVAVTDLTAGEQPTGGGSITRFTVTLSLPHANEVRLVAQGGEGYGAVQESLCTRGTQVSTAECRWTGTYGDEAVVGTFDVPILGTKAGTLHYAFCVEIDARRTCFAANQSGVSFD